MKATVALTILAAALAVAAHAEQCGEQADGKACPDCQCCSQWGWCGTDESYCGPGCQSQCNGCEPTPTPTPSGGDGVGSIVTRELFDEMLPHRDEQMCPARGFYTYDAFIAAAAKFDNFGMTGDEETRKREIAAFFAQTSHETTGGWPGSPDGPYAWGYCFKEDFFQTEDYCVPSKEWPCAAGKKYYGRGPMQISYNYNYGPAGAEIGVDLLNNPDIVSTDPIISFETAFWYWMTPHLQVSKPSCHDVMTGEWTPTTADSSGKRLPGFGVTTNILNGEIECGNGKNRLGEDRIGFYKRYCELLGVSYGPNLDCYNQTPYGSGIGRSAQ